MLVVFSAIGIALTFFLSNNISYAHRTIDSITNLDIGSNVCVNGFAKNVYLGKDYTLFNLLNKSSNNSINIVFFDAVNINKTREISVCGRVDFYKGELEIKGHKVI